MAISPGIPTSFVPKQPFQPMSKRPMSSGSNIFLMATLSLAGLALLSAGAVFGYDKYLDSTLVRKQALLSEAQGRVSEDTIEEFVRLRDRLSSGQALMDSHIELSQFFTQLEALTLQNVRFSSMKMSLAGDNTARLQMNGTARNFNALAAQSNAFAADKRIKRAIFSGISLNDARLVSFTLTADIDSRLIVESASAAAAPVQAPVEAAPPVATTTPVVPAATTTAPKQTGTTSVPTAKPTP